MKKWKFPKFPILMDAIITISGGLVMGLSIFVAMQDNREWDDRTFWMVYAIWGFLVMKWGVDESRYDKKRLEDKESADKHLPT
jgi:hypothetical protein